MSSAVLGLEDGSVFYGKSIGVEGESSGEIVFNTAMSGYQEILTDPSYRKQIITFTYPQIGNTGINPEDYEPTRCGLRVWFCGVFQNSAAIGGKRRLCVISFSSKMWSVFRK